MRDHVLHAIGEVLAFGVGVALSPLAIVALVVLLVGPRGAWPAWLFAGVWVASLALGASLVLLLADGADASASGEPQTWVSIVKLVLGGLLVLFAVRQLAARDISEAKPEAPAWMQRLDNASATQIAGLSALFAAVKPKNLLLTIGAGLAVAQVGAAPAAQAAAIAVYVALASVGLAIPLAIHVLMRERGRRTLVALRDWMVRENATIIGVICLVIAAKLLGDGISSLGS